jgi:hypothetical protein
MPQSFFLFAFLSTFGTAEQTISSIEAFFESKCIPQALKEMRQAAYCCAAITMKFFG